MPPRPERPLSFHGDFWQGLTKLSISHQASGALVVTILTFAPVALLIWALTAHAQGTARDSDLCKSPSPGDKRSLTHGFIGNSDFYGLGIRLGIYLQWLASLVANPLLKSERTTMASAYLTFSLALAVAVLLLVFRRECTFTAEIIAVLNIFWGGTLLVMVPFVRLLADIKTTGLGLALIPLMLSMLPVSTWFWLRLAFWGEIDFAMTPGGGTYTFLLAPVAPSHFQGFSIFMTILCLPLCLIPIFSSMCLSLALFLDWIGQQPPGWGQPEPPKNMKAKIMHQIEKLKNRWTKTQTKKRSARWISAIAGVVIACWSILGVELTLVWNGVTKIYSVESTGQIIPLVIGVGIFIRVLWILHHGKVPD